MEKSQEFAKKIKKLSSAFEKDLDNLLKDVESKKSLTGIELKVCTFYENLLQANQFLCEIRCIVLQMKYDLHNMKSELVDNKSTKDEKQKLVLDLYNIEELYEEVKVHTLKILHAIVEKRTKMKFTLQELQIWQEAHTYKRGLNQRPAPAVCEPTFSRRRTVLTAAAAANFAAKLGSARKPAVVHKFC